MSPYSDDTYGERVAGVYDTWYDQYEPQAITLLSELAGSKRALELGIGTGRIALPLAASNIEVHGLDASPSMVERLRAKPGGDRITVGMGNFADVAVEGEFTLIYIVFNTFFALTSQGEQVRCFRNVAQHLASNGTFLIEAFVPDLKRFTGGQVNWVTRVGDDSVELDVGQHDAAAQKVTSNRIILTNGDVRLYPIQIRYAWPAELDLMAQLAGLRLHERWSSWERMPFTSESQKHISIYRHASL